MSEEVAEHIVTMNENIIQHQKEMKEQFFQGLKDLENGTRESFSGAGAEMNITAIYIRLIGELGEINEIYKSHFADKEEYINNYFFDCDYGSMTLKTQEE